MDVYYTHNLLVELLRYVAAVEMIIWWTCKVNIKVSNVATLRARV